MESLSSSGELSDTCRDTSLSVERLANRIVQQTLIRQPWPPPPCALISIARGCGNPRQGPAEKLNYHCCSLLAKSILLPSYLNPDTRVCPRHMDAARSGEGPGLIVLALRYARPTMLGLSFIIAVWSVQPFEICRPTLPLSSSRSLYHSLSHSLCYIGSWAWLSFWHQRSIDAPRPALIG